MGPAFAGTTGSGNARIPPVPCSPASTIGAIYALVALGFTLIYNASDVINFAQGEFVMLGGMVTFFAVAAGVPMPLAVLIAVLVRDRRGPAAVPRSPSSRRAARPPVTLIIITIGASIFLRGVAAIVFDKNFTATRPSPGASRARIGGATLLPQSLIVLVGTGVIVLALWAVPDQHADRQGAGRDGRQIAWRRALVGINTERASSGLSFAVVGGDRRDRRHPGSRRSR